jgi:hypothetical protein
MARVVHKWQVLLRALQLSPLNYHCTNAPGHDTTGPYQATVPRDSLTGLLELVSH